MFELSALAVAIGAVAAFLIGGFWYAMVDARLAGQEAEASQELPAKLLIPAVLFAGSMVHERYPGRLAAVHLGDWLLKLIAIGAAAGAVG